MKKTLLMLLVPFYIAILYAVIALIMIALEPKNTKIKMPKVNGYANYKLYDFIY